MDIGGLMPGFENALVSVLAFVVALSVIVAIHEYGHYIVGRWCGIKAEVFSLGFGPVLVSRVDRHGTRWQIAALPLGGYVKFLGDANAASAASAKALDEIPPELHRQTMTGAPLWARVLTVAAGPVFNFVLAALIFWGLFLVNGRAIEPLTVGALKPLPVSGYGLKEGDEIIEIAGVKLGESGGFDGTDHLPDTALVDYLVKRDGQEISVTGPQPMPPLVSGLAPKSAAYAVDMRPGDVITRVNDTPIYRFDQFKTYVEAAKGAPLKLEVWREGQLLDFVLVPRQVDEPDGKGGFVQAWRVGIAGDLAFSPATESPGMLRAGAASLDRVWSIISGSVSGLYHMITGAISSCNMSGPIGIAQASGTMASQGTQSFISFVAVLSTAIGFLNLLPVPVLDGGHLMFYAYEAVARRPVSERALNLFMAIGLGLLISLMVFALSNDLFCP